MDHGPGKRGYWDSEGSGISGCWWYWWLVNSIVSVHEFGSIMDIGREGIEVVIPDAGDWELPCDSGDSVEDDPRLE